MTILTKYPRTIPMLMGFVLLVALTSTATAQGIIVDRNWNFGSVYLERSDVDISIRNNVAHVTIDHEFRNTGRSIAEGVFLFPLPVDASVADFKMEMDGKLVGGEVLPADEAKAIYQRIVRKNLDPALLEWVDGRSFRASIFPIAANATQRIVLEYDLVVDQVGNRFRFVHPLAGTVGTNRTTQARPPWIVRPPFPRPGPRPDHRPRDERRDRQRSASPDRAVAPELSLTVSIDAGDATQLRNVYSPSHKIDTEYRDNHTATANLEALNEANSSFVLYYSLDTKRISATLIPYRPYRDQPGYFMLMLAPPTKPTGKIQPKEIVFVLDTSGSMAGEKIEQAKEALKYALNRLGPDDSFGLIAFSSDLDAFDTSLSNVSAVDDALFFVDQLQARGGTNINDAVLKAITLLNGSENGSIVFLTDGLPSSGVTDVDDIINNVTKANKNELTVFSFGVGYDVNTRLLGELSESTAAFAEYVTPEENLEEIVSSFYDRIRYPVMTDVSISIPSVGVHSMAPRALPDLFVGDPLVLTGRYRTSGKTTAILTGIMDGKKTTIEYRLDFPTRSRTDQFVARTWATRRVGQLLADIRKNGDKDELREEIVALATEYGIVTPYTSYLVREDESPTASVGMRFRRLANTPAAAMQQSISMEESGRDAVSASKQSNRMQRAEGYDDTVNLGIQVADQNLVVDEDGTWKSNLALDEKKTNGKPAIKIEFASDAYFALLARYPEMKEFLRVGSEVEFVFHEQLLRIGPEGRTTATDADFTEWFGS
jgi:Ca-activated chloride channel family protein